MKGLKPIAVPAPRGEGSEGRRGREKEKFERNVGGRREEKRRKEGERQLYQNT